MIRFIFLMYCFGLNFCQAQSFEYYAGPNFNMAVLYPRFEFNDVWVIYPGFSTGFLHHFQTREKTRIIGLSYENYSGKFKTGYYGAAGGSAINGQYYNHSISLDLYPFVRTYGAVELAFGTKISYRFHSQIEGYSGYWSTNMPPLYYKSYLDGSDGRKLIVGLVFQFGIPIQLTETLKLTPRCFIYQGISADYQGEQNVYKRMISPQIGFRKVF